jgi:hypothetical protein
MLKAALKYARVGFYVFPVGKNKAPLTKNGFHDAEIEEEKIKKLWENSPVANIGIAVGKSKLTIIDIDVKNGIDIDWFIEYLENQGPIPETIQTETPSGGRHIWFKNNNNLDISSATNKIMKGVDILSKTGYILVPPSITTKGRYSFYDEYNDLFEKGTLQEIPNWLHNQLVNQRTNNKSKILVNNVLEENLIILSEKEFKEIRSALQYISNYDDYDIWLKIGMALKTTMSIQSFGLWCEWSEQSEKFNIKDHRKIWDKINDFGDITIATLFYIAKENGWYPPEDYRKKNLNIELKKETKQEERKNFPQHLLKIPGLVGDIANYILNQAHKPQPLLSLAASLSACGTIMGRKVQTSTGLRTNIYTIAVGESGCGKEVPRQIIRRIFNEADIFPQVAVEDIASDSSIITSLSKEPSSLFLLDEIGRFFKSTQSYKQTAYLYKISGLFLRLYGAANGPFCGKIYSDSEKNKIIQQPNVSIFGTTVPKTLYESLSMDEVSDGFLSRFLIFESENPDPDKQKIIMNPVPDKIIENIQLWKNISENIKPYSLVDIIPKPIIIQKTKNAEEIFDEFENQLQSFRNRLRKDKKPASLYVRTSAQAEKLALIRACGIAHDQAIIDEQDALWACELSKFISDNIYYIVEHYVSDNKTEDNIKRLLRYVKESGTDGILIRDLKRKNQRIKKSERDEIIKHLLETDQIFLVERKNEESKRMQKFFIYNNNIGG